MDDKEDIIITSGSGTDTIDLGDYNLNNSNFGTITIDTSNLGYNGTYIGTGASGTSYSWVQPYTNYSITESTNPSVHINTDGISMPKGTDIKVGGKSLIESIEKIEERLGILNPNPELEERWEQLKELRKQYIDLEKDLLEKEKLMKILKEQ